MQGPHVLAGPDGLELRVNGLTEFAYWPAACKAAGVTPKDLERVRRLLLTNCRIDGFSFLQTMPSLERLGFLACDSGVWQTLQGSGIATLRLHNLKQGKEYLSRLDFLSAFPNLEALYLNLLGLSALPDLSRHERLHTVVGVFRNENHKAAPFDFSALEFAPALTVFASWMAVDCHRIPAEAFLPILRNPSLRRLEVTQMFVREDKKLAALMKEYRPALLEAPAPPDPKELVRCFVW